MAAPTITITNRRKPTGEKPERYHVVVMGRDGATPCALPRVGEVLIGRDEDADVRIIDPQASRHHARILLGDPIQVEDLGSRNGTRLRDQPLEAGQLAPFHLGDAIAIGSTVIILQGGEPELEGHRVWAHGYLEMRVVEECARAQSRGSQFGLARIRISGQVAPVLVEPILAEVLRDGDLLAMYAPGEYEALLLDCEEKASRRIADGMVAALAARQISATCGLALYPADGTSPQALVGRASERVRFQTGTLPPTPGVIIESPAMRAVYDLAKRAAASNSNVLILGETGAGKEVLAETVHRFSPRADKPFLPINCAAFSESLVESELFGYEKGAFTGANQAKTGLLEAASGGTLFLDEIGEMPLSIQAKLLRVLETKQVMRVGATKARAIDVRFVAATNRDLEEEVAEKRFREDLYFRLNVISLEIPPLRERAEEIEGLARLFLDKLARALDRPTPSLAAEALSLLRAYTWPGNIRELRNVIERAFVLCSGPLVTPEHLPVEKMSRHRRTPDAPPVDPAGSAPPEAALLRVVSAGRGMKEIEREAIVDALARCDGNQTRAAELLGMPRRTFCKRIKDYEIPRPRA